MKKKKLNGTKAHVLRSKKAKWALCKKDLLDAYGVKDFTEGKKYRIIEKGHGWLLLRNNHKHKHHITNGVEGWFRFFIS